MGSEMCIRDSRGSGGLRPDPVPSPRNHTADNGADEAAENPAGEQTAFPGCSARDRAEHGRRAANEARHGEEEHPAAHADTLHLKVSSVNFSPSTRAGPIASSMAARMSPSHIV